MKPSRAREIILQVIPQIMKDYNLNLDTVHEKATGHLASGGIEFGVMTTVNLSARDLMELDSCENPTSELVDKVLLQIGDVRESSVVKSRIKFETEPLHKEIAKLELQIRDLKDDSLRKDGVISYLKETTDTHIGGSPIMGGP